MKILNNSNDTVYTNPVELKADAIDLPNDFAVTTARVGQEGVYYNPSAFSRFLSSAIEAVAIIALSPLAMGGCTREFPDGIESRGVDNRGASDAGFDGGVDAHDGVDVDAVTADTEDTLVADSDGDGIDDTSVNPDIINDAGIDAVTADTEDTLVADSDGDGIDDTSVNPDIIDDTGIDADTEDTFVADSDGDGIDDTSVNPDIIDDTGIDADTEDTFVADSDGDGIDDTSVNSDIIEDTGIDTAPDTVTEDTFVPDTIVNPDTAPDAAEDTFVADSGSDTQDATDAADSEDTADTQDTNTPPALACTPKQNKITCNPGETVTVSYSVKGATEFACASEKQSVPSFDSNTMSTKVACETLSVNCSAQNSLTQATEACAPVAIVQNNFSPTVELLSPSKNSDGLGVLPDGNACFSANNKVHFKFKAADINNDPLTCGLSIYSNGKLVTEISSTFSKNGEHTLSVPANQLSPLTDYSAALYCDDNMGSGKVQSNPVAFTTSDTGLAWFGEFNPSNGNTTLDSSGNNIDGVLKGANGLPKFTTESDGSKVITLDGTDDFVQISTPTLNSFSAMSVYIRFKRNPSIDSQVIFDKAGGGSRIIAEIQGDALVFGACGPKVSCSLGNLAVAKTKIETGKYYEVLGIINAGAFSIYVNDLKTPEAAATNAPDITWNTSSDIMIGRRVLENDRYFSGNIDEFRIYGIDVYNYCQ